MNTIDKVFVSAGARSTGTAISANTTCAEAIQNANNIQTKNGTRINYLAFEIEDEDNIQEKLQHLHENRSKCYLLSLLKQGQSYNYFFVCVTTLTHPDASAKTLKPKRPEKNVTNINLVGQYVQTLEKEFGDMTKKLNLADESVYEGIRDALDKAKIVIQNTNQAAANYGKGGGAFVEKIINNFKSATKELEDSQSSDPDEKVKNLVSKLVTSLQGMTAEHKTDLSELIKMVLKIMEAMLNTSSYNQVVNAIKKLPEIQG